jgi:predicted amidohydrolase YtcJ
MHASRAVRTARAAVTDQGEPLSLANALLPPPASRLSQDGRMATDGYRLACVTIADGRIAAISARPPHGARVTDLAGASVLPGFADAHTHLDGAAENLCTVNWTLPPDRRGMLNRVRSVANRLEPGGWILGGRWSRRDIPDGELPGRPELDDASAARPLLLADIEQSLMLLNSAAIRLCRIEPPGANARTEGVELGDSGEPTGRLRGAAARMAAAVVPPVNTYLKLARLRVLLADLTARGVTEVHDIASYPSQDAALTVNLERSYSDLSLIDELQARGQLPVRVGYRPPLQRVAEHDALTARHADDAMVFPAGYKLFLDDGWYGTAPGERRDEYRYPGAAQSARLIKAAQVRNAAVSIHACGDLGVAEALCLLSGHPAERRQPGQRQPGQRQPGQRRPAPGAPPHRIVHARRIRPGDIARCARLGVVIETQPWQVIGLADLYREPAFAHADSLISPYASLLGAGVTVAFSSDRRAGTRPDLLDADPLTGIQIAMTRSWDCDPQQPDQRLDADQAFACACRAGAVAAGVSGRRGAIWPGADADLVIIGGDPWRTDPAAIASLPVLATITAGQVVHDGAGLFRAGTCR